MSIAAKHTAVLHVAGHRAEAGDQQAPSPVALKSEQASALRAAASAVVARASGTRVYAAKRQSGDESPRARKRRCTPARPSQDELGMLAGPLRDNDGSCSSSGGCTSGFDSEPQLESEEETKTAVPDAPADATDVDALLAAAGRRDAALKQLHDAVDGLPTAELAQMCRTVMRLYSAGLSARPAIVRPLLDMLYLSLSPDMRGHFLASALASSSATVLLD
eukprot:PLAT15324.1.p1 GENE.PLAT15324.1~~PLAT15324.1.p1  ORF type:complete len:220 (+),score=91.18 PLAT15324.1:86-745(+)